MTTETIYKANEIKVGDFINVNWDWAKIKNITSRGIVLKVSKKTIVIDIVWEYTPIGLTAIVKRSNIFKTGIK